jgi:hypothetical protein
MRSQEQWTQETGLSRWEQETARRALRRCRPAGGAPRRHAGKALVPSLAPTRLMARPARSMPERRAGDGPRRSCPWLIDARRDATCDPRYAAAVSRRGAAVASSGRCSGRHIAFHRRLVDLTASVKAALLLSQSIYWTRHGQGHRPDRRMVPQDRRAMGDGDRLVGEGAEPARARCCAGLDSRSMTSAWAFPRACTSG